MLKPTFSSACRLEIFDLESVYHFAIVNGVAELGSLEEPVPLTYTPGTIRTNSDGSPVAEHKITYTRTDYDDSDMVRLRLLGTRRLLARWVDQRGRLRLLGTPNCPVKLTYKESDGVLTVTLSCKTSELLTFAQA